MKFFRASDLRPANAELNTAESNRLHDSFFFEAIEEAKKANRPYLAKFMETMAKYYWRSAKFHREVESSEVMGEVFMECRNQKEFLTRLYRDAIGKPDGCGHTIECGRYKVRCWSDWATCSIIVTDTEASALFECKKELQVELLKPDTLADRDKLVDVLNKIKEVDEVIGIKAA